MRVNTLSHQSRAGLCVINPRAILHEGFIRHINPLMFDVIDDKPEGFIMYKHKPSGRGFMHYHIDHQPCAGLCVINPRVILHEGFIIQYQSSYLKETYADSKDNGNHSVVTINAPCGLRDQK